MKSDDIKRSVRAQRHDRSAGDSPNIGRVSRMPGTGMPKGERRKRKRGEGGRNNKVRQGRAFVIKVWSVLLLVGALLCLGVMFWFGFRNRGKAVTAQPVVIPAVEEEKKKDEKPPGFPTPTEDEAIALAEQALSARDVGGISSHFRITKTSPEDALEFLKSREGIDGPVAKSEWIGGMDANGLQIEGVLVHFKAPDGKPRNRVALLTPDKDGVWKADFDAFARTSTPLWPEFLEGGAEAIQARVYIARDNYYNGPFADEAQWICYGIASPDTDEVFFGYCKADSPQAQALNWTLSKHSSLGRVTVELRKDPAARPRQFLISTVIAQDWVTAEKTFDEGFK